MKRLTNFAQRLYFRLDVLLRAVNLWHGTHGFTSLPKEVVKKICGTTALKSQDRLKQLLPDGSAGDLIVSKALSSTLISVFLTGFHYSYQAATQLASRGWVDPVPDPILLEKFLGYSRESNPGSLGWQSDVLTTIPNRRSKEVILRIFTLWKNPSTPAGIEPTNLRSRGEYDNP